MNTITLIRLAKILLTAFFGLYVAMACFGNITDYGSNFLFVKHVMSMDTTFEGNALMYRAVTAPALHHTAYLAIIVFELFTALLCLAGAFQMFRRLKADAVNFHKSKVLALAGLLCGITIWFFVFQIIAGEWFAMWQSDMWNGLAAASRLTTFNGIALISLMLPEDAAAT